MGAALLIYRCPVSVPIQFDKPRELKFDLRATKDLEAAMGGQPLGAIVLQLQQVGVTAITTALYHGLKHEDKGLSVPLVTKMLEQYITNKGSLRKLGRALSDAIYETGLFKTEAEELEDDEGNVSGG
jgi:hypothetical protein